MIATRFSKVSIIVEGLQREPLISHRAQMAVRAILLYQQVLKNVDAGRQVLILGSFSQPGNFNARLTIFCMKAFARRSFIWSRKRRRGSGPDHR